MYFLSNRISHPQSTVSDAVHVHGDGMSSHKTITVSKNGPYIVPGSVSLRLEIIGVNAAGESTEWDEGNAFPASPQYALCRCGNSNKKPFCCATHAKIGFDGTETVSRKPVTGRLGGGTVLACAQGRGLDSPQLREELCSGGGLLPSVLVA